MFTLNWYNIMCGRSNNQCRGYLRNLWNIRLIITYKGTTIFVENKLINYITLQNADL